MIFSKKNLKYIVRIFISLGFEKSIISRLNNIPKYLSNKKEWIKQGGKVDKEFLMLNDFYSESGVSKGDYFHQDLLVAGFVNINNPKRHIDVGSRIDGFVAHVASFRKIEVIDIRPLNIKSHKNIKFLKYDLTSDIKLPKTDSLSCLHAIEHFGLGRYGDPININGHLIALNMLINMVESKGMLYISFPIGIKNEVHFNSQRVFDARMITNLNIVKEKLQLVRFDYIDENGELKLNRKLKEFLSKNKYGCGIYTFKKN